MNDLFKRTSKFSNIEEKLNSELLKKSLPQSLPQLVKQKSTKRDRIQRLEDRLGLKPSTTEERFEDTLKEFKGLDTFFTINQLLQELNLDAPDEKQNELHAMKIKHLLEKEKLKKWKNDYPHYLQFDQQQNGIVKNPLIKRARECYNIQEQEPLLCQTMGNLKEILKQKFESINLNENPQLQLFKDITDSKPLEAEQRKKKLPTFFQRVQESLIVHQPKEINFDEYYKKFSQEAEQLRNRLKDQQITFFNKKWGNSVVKMKVKEAQFKRSMMFKSQKSKIYNFRREQTLPQIVHPELKEIIDDICYEEMELLHEKNSIRQALYDMQKEMEKDYGKYDEQQLMGLRMALK